MDDLEFFSKTAMRLLNDIPEQQLYDTICDILHRLVKDTIVLITEFDAAGSSASVRSVAGPDEIIGSVKNASGYDVKELTVRTEPVLLGLFKEGSFTRLDDELLRHYLERLPEPVFRAIEGLGVVEGLYSMPFVSQDDCLGMIVLIELKGRPIRDFRPVEAMVDLAAMALHRRKALVELLQARTELENRVAVRTEQQKRAEARLKQLSSQLLNAQELERERIGRDIHDSIGQSLTAIKLKAEHALIKSRSDLAGNTQASVESIISLVQESIREVRRIQRDLRHPSLDDLGLGPTITSLCREFREACPDMRLAKRVNINERHIPSSMKTMIYRICQEALSNVAKHSGASRAHLRLTAADGHIRLFISDNGRGFDPDAIGATKTSSRGLGLDSMRERAEFMGGSLKIQSRIGEGTELKADWPVDEPVQPRLDEWPEP